MKVVMLMELEDGVCNEIRLLRSTSFDSERQATGTRMGVLAPVVTCLHEAPVIAHGVSVSLAEAPLPYFLSLEPDVIPA